jgi:DNA-directed RNA polymerase specialized sigma24 family protein
MFKKRLLKMDEEIVEKLDLMIKLLALNVMDTGNSQKEDIIQLARVGIQPKDIAKIIGTSSNTVSVTLSRARSEGLLK